MIKRLKSPKNRLKIDFNPDLVVVCSEKVGTFGDIHLFLGIYIPVDTMYYSPCRGRRWSCGVPEKSLIFGVLWNVVGSKLLKLLIFYILLPRAMLAKRDCCLRCRQYNNSSCSLRCSVNSYIVSKKYQLFFGKTGGKIAIFIFHTSTLPHKNMSQLLRMPEKITTFAG